jgi:hypothetical protein
VKDVVVGVQVPIHQYDFLSEMPLKPETAVGLGLLRGVHVEPL